MARVKIASVTAGRGVIANSRLEISRLTCEQTRTLWNTANALGAPIGS